MDTIIPYALLCFTSFFTLTNPLGTMPVFLTMTNGLSEDERKHIIKRATIVSFIILITFTLCGQFLFKFFGISTNGFRIAAGFIILKIGYDMLQARYSSAKLKEEEIKSYVNDISITPLLVSFCSCGTEIEVDKIKLINGNVYLSGKFPSGKEVNKPFTEIWDIHDFADICKEIGV